MREEQEKEGVEVWINDDLDGDDGVWGGDRVEEEGEKQ